MKLVDEGYMLLAKPRVIHSIPGRLRLQFPLLKRLDREYHNWSELLGELMREVQGVLDISANHISGTVLFHYDSKLITDKEILSFITAMNRVLISQKDDLARVLEKDSETVLRCLRDWLKRSVKRRLRLDTNQRILQDDFF